MSIRHPRMVREAHTIEAMLGIYCRAHHDVKDKPCPECTEILSYSRGRLEKCRFQEEKPTCANCPIHCYRPAMRDKVRDVMRYSGPRMLFRHPVLALFHFIYGFRKVPARPKRSGSE